MHKLSRRDADELRRVSTAQLDGVLWEDRYRVARIPKGGYAVKHARSGRVIARHALIESALEDARRRNWGR